MKNLSWIKDTYQNLSRGLDMQKYNKFYWGVIGVIIIGSLSFSFFARYKLEYVDIASGFDKIKKVEYSYIDRIDYYNGLYKEFENLEKLINDSELVVKGKKISEELVAGAILSKFKISNIIRGDNSKQENIISVYEPVEISNQYYVTSPLGYKPMDKKHEYILFLDELEKPKDIKLSNKLEDNFIITNPLYGKVNTSEFTSIVTDIDGLYEIDFRGFKEYENIFISQDTENEYKEFREEVLKKLM